VCGDAIGIFPGVALDDAIASLRKRSPKRRETKQVQWHALPPEILGNISLMSGDSPSVICALGQVCSSWRKSLSVERSAWLSVTFKSVVCTASFVHIEKTCIPWALQKVEHSVIILCALKYNLSY